MKFDVITIGAAVRDVFLASDKFIAIKSNKFKTGLGECMSLGSKIELDKIFLTTGGGATNAAATFSSLGFKTACIAKIGNDAPGRDVLEDLQKFKVNTKLIKQVPKGQTAYSTILTMMDGERTVLVYRGVSSSFKSSDIAWKALWKTKWIYLTSLGGDIALAKKIIEHAHSHKVKIAWNPGSGELKKGFRTFEPLLAKIDILNMNLEEAELLTKEKTPRKMLKKLGSTGTVRIITDGTKGSYVLKDNHIIHSKTSGTKGISRTGAGDAFGSGFLASYIKHNDIKKAAQTGTLNAESVIKSFGAKEGILSSWPKDSHLKKISAK
jgi:sugar/nucleoside kinase (ribokinase family)